MTTSLAYVKVQDEQNYIKNKNDIKYFGKQQPTVVANEDKVYDYNKKI